tara:strand:- start:766 stop:1131 length:366 start_codon:yes stop_codon:yes gene_type:complete
MRAIRVIVSKKPVNSSLSQPNLESYITNFINMQNSLTCSASGFPGFIDSSSYWKINNNYKNYDVSPIINISEWEDINLWNSWYNSLERKYIVNNKAYKNINFDTSIDICKQRIPYDNIPLL